MKPESFFDLPNLLQEPLLWDMELKYDSYDSSKESCIHQITNGFITEANRKIIESHFQNVSESFLSSLARSVKEDALRDLAVLDKFIEKT